MAKSTLDNIIDFKIIIVEDDLITNRAIEIALNFNGFYNIIKAKNHDELYKGLSDFEIHLIIMNMELGHSVTAKEVTHQITESTRIPIIFITSSNDDESFDRALKSFPITIMNKPIDFKQLINTVICALNMVKQN